MCVKDLIITIILFRSSNCDCSSSANNGSGCACADGENLNGGVGGGTNTGGVSSGVGSSSANGNGGNGNGGVNGAAATGQHAGKETLLAWNAQFSSISALTVSPDGVLHVADQVINSYFNNEIFFSRVHYIFIYIPPKKLII